MFFALKIIGTYDFFHKLFLEFIPTFVHNLLNHLLRLGLIEEPLITNEESNVEESPDNTDGIQVLDEEIVGDQANITTAEAPNLELEIRSESTSSLDETDIDFLEDADKDKDVFRTKTFMYVSDLARKSPRDHAKKSSLYHWNLITIAIFYGLPVVQLVLTYQVCIYIHSLVSCLFNVYFFCLLFPECHQYNWEPRSVLFQFPLYTSIGNGDRFQSSFFQFGLCHVGNFIHFNW